MNLEDLKKQYVREQLGVDPAVFLDILTFIDFGNVNYWFRDDARGVSGEALADGMKVGIDLGQLQNFLALFSFDQRFYYGHDAQKPNGISFITAAKHIFGKSRVFTKPIQKIRHHLDAEELLSETRTQHSDRDGIYVQVPKCNFDVEISVDAMRLLAKYQTFCILSGDSDFVSLLRFLKSQGKKTILIKGGYVQQSLAEMADLVINAQDIKVYIGRLEAKKQKPGSEPGLANSQPVSTGR